MKSLKIQVIRQNEDRGLAYVQKHIDLGWRPVSRFALGSEVYFVNLVWEKESDPLYPPESQSSK